MGLFLIILLFAMPVFMVVVAMWKGWKYWVLFLSCTILYYLWALNITDDGSASGAISVVLLQTFPLIGAGIGLTFSAVALIWRNTFLSTGETQSERLKKRREMRRIQEQNSP